MPNLRANSVGPVRYAEQWNLIAGPGLSIGVTSDQIPGELDILIGTTGGSGNGIDPALIDAKGDLIVGVGDNLPARKAVGPDGSFLKSNSAQADGLQWAALTEADVAGLSGDLANKVDKAVVDANGDLLVGTAPDTVVRKPVGTNGTFLKANSVQADGLEWATLAEADVANLTTDLAAKVDRSLVDLKGDLFVGTADNAVGRQAVGANNAVLTADSAQTTGIKWVQVGDAMVAAGSNLAKLAYVTGTPNGAQFLRDDGAWAAPPGGALTRTAQLSPGAATVPDGSAGNLAPALMRMKGTEATPQKHFMYLAFDAAQAEHAWWTFRLPSGYVSGGTVKLLWMANAVAGNVVWAASIAAVTPGDVDTPVEHASAAATSVTTAVNTTEARRLVESAITLANLDSVAAGDLVSLHVYRDGANASDTCTVDAELVNAALEFTG